MSNRLSLFVLMISLSAILVAKEGTVTADLNMRLGPGVEHPVVGVLPPGASVSIVATSGQWYQINPKAVVEGYVVTKHLKGSRVLMNTAFRTEASDKAASMGVLKKHLVVKVLGREGDWSKIAVTNPKGLKIFVHGDYIKKGPAPVVKKAPFEGVKPNYSVLVYDVKKKKELWGQNENKPVPIASVTKMMTLLLGLEKLESDPKVTLDTMVPISEAAAAEPPTKACLIAGKEIKLGELLREEGQRQGEGPAHEEHEIFQRARSARSNARQGQRLHAARSCQTRQGTVEA